MKKTFYLLVAIAFIFSLAAISTAKADDSEDIDNEDVLEKIISPDQIKNFQVMKRVGNALFGIRKATGTPMSASTTAATVRQNKQLEKIAAPALINLYEKIQRIGNALWGIRKDGEDDNRDNNYQIVSNLVIKPEMAACVAAAIDVKDKALMVRVASAAEELNAALTTRSACQQAAVVATTTPREAVNSCVKAFGEVQKNIKKVSKTIQTETWNTYKDSLKACWASVGEASSTQVIEDGESVFD